MKDRAGIFGNRDEGRTEKHERHPCMAIRLMMASGNQVSVNYGSIVGSPFYSPSHGIQFVFEAAHPPGEQWGRWRLARWAVTITGSNLSTIYDHLCLAKQVFVKEGENEGDGRPHVTGIGVEEIELEVSAAMGARRD